MTAGPLASIPPTAWGMAALIAGAVLVIGAFGHLRRAWHQRRLDRRLARDPYILREELDDYHRAIGDEPVPLDPARLLLAALLAGAAAGIPVWLSDYGLAEWWHAALLALALFAGTWRWLNDPEPKPLTEALLGPDVHVPPEAVFGLAGGLALTGLVVLFAVWL